MQYDYFGFIVALLISIGGLIGYFKAGMYDDCEIKKTNKEKNNR